MVVGEETFQRNDLPVESGRGSAARLEPITEMTAASAARTMKPANARATGPGVLPLLMAKCGPVLRRKASRWWEQRRPRERTAGASLGTGGRGLGPILQNPHALQRHEALQNHFVEVRQQPVQVLLRINKPDNAGGLAPTVIVLSPAKKLS